MTASPPEQPGGDDPYVTLGVTRDAPRDEIRRAHRELVAYYAPAAADGDASAGERLHRVNEAWTALSSPTRRRAIDRALADGGEAGVAGAARPLSGAAAAEADEGTRAELLGEMEEHRRTLARMALTHGPLTLVLLALGTVPLTAVLDGRGAALIPLVIIGLFALASAFQLTTALRDLRARPAFTRGEVRRAWTKGGLLWFFPSHFVMLGRRNVFVLRPDVWLQVKEGEILECHHWPHTRTVIRAWRLAVRRVLFVGAGDPARSRIAEALLRERGGAEYEARSAGSDLADVHPLALRVLDEDGADAPRAAPADVEDCLDEEWDCVITVCDRARETRPVFPRARRTLHWSVPDPAAAGGSEDERLEAFRAAREDLRGRIEAFVQAGAGPISPP